MGIETGYVSEEQRNGRLIAGGEITSLAADFKLKESKPFSVYVKPVSGTDTTVLLTVKLPANASATPMPFKTEQWSEALVEEIDTASASILENDQYDLYWASGDDNVEVDS